MTKTPINPDFLNLNRVFRATGMPPMEIGATLAGQIACFPWPTTKSEWVACLPDLVKELTPWSVLVTSLQPLIGGSTGLTWPVVFTALHTSLNSIRTRVDFVNSIIRGHVDEGWPQTLFDTTFNYCSRAGVHPASVVLSCYPHWNTSKVAELLLDRWGKEGLNPIPYDDSDWGEGICKWGIAPQCFDSMDGIITTMPVSIGTGDVPENNGDPQFKLGDQILIGGAAEIIGIKNLQSLGNDIQVFGDLELYNLPNLITIGTRVAVRGDLVVRNCPNLNQLPHDLKVAGRIYFPDARPGFAWGETPRVFHGTLFEFLHSKPTFPSVQCPEDLVKIAQMPW